MNLQSLLGDVPVQRFVADHFQRLPYSAAGLAAATVRAWDVGTR